MTVLLNKTKLFKPDIYISIKVWNIFIHVIDFKPLFGENIFKSQKWCILQIQFCLLIGFYIDISSEGDLKIEFQLPKKSEYLQAFYIFAPWLFVKVVLYFSYLARKVLGSEHRTGSQEDLCLFFHFATDFLCIFHYTFSFPYYKRLNRSFKGLLWYKSCRRC